MIKDWQKRLKCLPEWVRSAVSHLGDPYSYIAYRLAEKADNFVNEVQPELERKLLGTTDINCDFPLDAQEQRYRFMLAAIRHADYFRPMSPSVVQKIPETLRPNRRPSADWDFDEQARLRRQIADAARGLASLLRQHHEVVRRLGVGKIDCDPLDLLANAGDAGRRGCYLDGVEGEYAALAMRRGIEDQPSRALAGLIDQLHLVASAKDRGLLPAKVRLGMSSRKKEMHFMDAFEGWLAESVEEAGGLIPNGFKLSDGCWASLISCLTYKDVGPRSVEIYRARVPGYIENAINLEPRFDLESLLEQWAKEGGKVD